MFTIAYKYLKIEGELLPEILQIILEFANCFTLVNNELRFFLHTPKIKKISAKKILGKKYPLNPSMNINKLKKIINKK